MAARNPCLRDRWYWNVALQPQGIYRSSSGNVFTDERTRQVHKVPVPKNRQLTANFFFWLLRNLPFYLRLSDKSNHLFEDSKRQKRIKGKNGHIMYQAKFCIFYTLWSPFLFQFSSIFHLEKPKNLQFTFSPSSFLNKNSNFCFIHK